MINHAGIVMIAQAMGSESPRSPRWQSPATARPNNLPEGQCRVELNLFCRLQQGLTPETLVPEAATIMTEYRVRALPIADDGEVIGEITALSICKALNSTGKSDLTIDKVMTSHPVSVSVDDRLAKAKALKALQSRTYKYESTSWDIIKSLGARAIIKVGIKYMTNCKLRKWIDRQESLFREYSDYWGYGLYVGTK